MYPPFAFICLDPTPRKKFPILLFYFSLFLRLSILISWKKVHTIHYYFTDNIKQLEVAYIKFHKPITHASAQ